MMYRFDDIFNEDMYRSSKVLFVTGPHNIFNNIVSDRIKSVCTDEGDTKMDTELLEEFGIADSGGIAIPNSVDFESFRQMINMPAISGKWFTKVELGNMTKKQLDWLKNYMKEPSDNGVICLVGTEFRDYMHWLKDKAIAGSQEVNLISLSFPNYKSLKPIVKMMFESENARIEDRALELFILRMSSSYDDYIKVVEKICVENLPDGYRAMPPDEVPVITYDNTLNSMKGIENFVIDDFLYMLTMPLSSDKLSGKKVIYRMLGYLVEEYGTRGLVNKLSSKIDELLDFRYYINKGYIPVLVNFNVEEAKQLINGTSLEGTRDETGRDEPITKKSEYQFKRLARLAGRTSLQDWLYMKLILSNVKRYDENSYIRALYSLVSRSVLNDNRINNDIGISNMFTLGLDYIDSIEYTDDPDEIEV